MTDGAEASLTEAMQGGMLLPAQLSATARFCGTVRRMRRYLQGVQQINAGVASWQAELPDLGELQDDIERAVREDAP